MNDLVRESLQLLRNLYGDLLFLPLSASPPSLSPAASSQETSEAAYNPSSVSSPQSTTVQPGTESKQTQRLEIEKDLRQELPMESTLFPADDGIDPNWDQAQNLEELYQRIHQCRRCGLWQHRTNFVFGVGNPNADILFVGEGPGADEDRLGEPFVGRAGQLLNKILTAMGLQREDVYIANVVKCRPPGNRTPLPEEIIRCIPFLWKQIELIDPRFIVALGATAANALLKGNYKMGEIRGRAIPFDNGKRTLIATYHPAALLRNPGWKRKTWEDMQLLMKLYQQWKQQQMDQQ